MKGITGIAATILAASLAGACAPITTGSYFARSTDFNAYRTYEWEPADSLPTGDPRLDNNPFFKDHFIGAVEKALAARGFEQVGIGSTPDLLLHYHASITQRLVVNDVDRRSGACPSYDCTPRVEVFEAGTLLIDVVDARTKRLVWRGWAESGIAGALENADSLAGLIDKSVTEMMRRMPRPLVPPVTAG